MDRIIGTVLLTVGPAVLYMMTTPPTNPTAQIAAAVTLWASGAIVGTWWAEKDVMDK